MAERPRVFPGLLPDGEDFADDSYTRGELEAKDYQTLREIAAAHPSDDIHGAMGKQALLDGLAGKERLD